MATSLADALTNTSMIPAVKTSQLAPNAPTNTDRPKPPEGPAMARYDQDEARVHAAQQDRDAFAKQAPQFPTLAPEPKPDNSNDPIKGYISTIGVLGALGSAFARQPLTKSMNAAAATITAMKSNDEAAFKQKFDEWKVQNENAFKLIDYQNKIYDTIMKSKNTSVDEKLAEMQAHAAMFKDDYMMQLAKDRSFVDMEDLQLRREEAARKTQESTEKIQQAEDKRSLYSQWQKENPNATAQQKAAARSRIYDSAVASAAEKRETSTENRKSKQYEAIDALEDQIDDALLQIKDEKTNVGGFNLAPTGIQGMLARGAEGLNLGEGEGETKAPATGFRTLMNNISKQAQHVIGAGRYSTAAEKSMQDSLASLGALTNEKTSKAALEQLKKDIGTLRRETGKLKDKETDSGSKYSVGQEVTSPDGRKMRITGFDQDGTPLGEPVQ